MDFVGRGRELATLDGALVEVRSNVGVDRPGRCLILRGGRRVGKSALVEEFVRRAAVPNVYYTAELGAGTEALAEFVRAVGESSLPGAGTFADALPGNWAGALRLLAGALPTDQPSVVVLDEIPYLMDAQGAFESVLQRSWDRELSRVPVLLILIGSDLSMMDALTSYGRPFHQRGSELPIGPLNPADIAAMTGLAAAEAYDASLVTGGLPIIASRWRRGEDLWAFLHRELADQVSPLTVSAQLSLAAEVPDHTHARAVLNAIGAGERTFTNIARAAGGVAASTLSRSLDTLVAKSIVAADVPVALRPSKEKRYRITDPYLRFWFTFVGPYLVEIDRMRSDLTLSRIRQGWTSWRGRAVEPLVRESLARILPARGIPAAPVVGAYWTRSNDVEIDIVGADREPVARELLFVGSIKWREEVPFDRHDVATLARHRDRLTDKPIPMIAVSRSGTDARGLDAAFGPEELLGAWPGGG